jgi:putative aldouronate transport system permease protein
MLQEKGDRGLNITINVLLVLAAIICMYPIWYVIICSVSSPSAIALGEVVLWPVGFTMGGYEMMFQDNNIWIGYRNSIIYTTLATILSLAVQLSAGYALSRRIPGRRWLSTFFVLTMYFSGGAVPAYLLINEIGWIDNPIVMIVPGAMSAYNMIVARSFFIGSIPESLFDAARIDGCSYIRFFIKVVIPLSGAMIAIIALFNIQSNWNTYLGAEMYLINPNYRVLQQIINSMFNMYDVGAESFGPGQNMEDMMELLQYRKQLMKYCVIIAGVLPLVILYPFIQKFFVKGVMVGAVKG